MLKQRLHIIRINKPKFKNRPRLQQSLYNDSLMQKKMRKIIRNLEYFLLVNKASYMQKKIAVNNAGDWLNYKNDKLFAV